jgi:hypothetical protein
MGQTLASTPALNRKQRISLVVLLVAVTASWIVWSKLRLVDFPTTGGFAKEWLAHRERILRDPALNRYYSFQDLHSSDGHFRSPVGWRRDLTIAATETAPGEPSFRMVEGRWPGKRAVRLDQMPLESRPHQVQNRRFTVATWIRHLGGGMRLGGNTESEGTVVAVGDGVWVGWRLLMLYPCNSLVFEMGRPKPQPPVGVASMSRVPPNVWTHVACTWDGQDVRLFINGVLSGQTPYAGDFYPAKSHSKLRIGYVGNGLGSVRFEMDEFAVFDRPLTAEEILAHAWFQYPMEPDLEARFRNAGEKLMARQLGEARAAYETLSVDVSVPHDLQWLAKLRTAECLREQQDVEKALIIFSEVATSSESPHNLRSAALLESIMLREGVKSQTYQPWQTSLANDSINHYSLCQSSPEYDRALDAFRHAQADLNAVHWITRYDEEIRPVLESRCSKCHNDQQAEGGLSLAKYSNGEKAAEEGFVWEQVAARIHRKEMPPPGHPQLTETEIMLVEQWAESRPRSAFCEELATEENQRYFPGHVFSRRLNRTEYANAMRDLLGVSLTESEIPPQDGSGGEGFDTVGDVLFTSTAHVETYLRAAGGAVERALTLDLGQSDLSQRRILTVVPQSLNPESTLSDAEAARKILGRFARRAWRRPVEDLEIDALEKLFLRSLENGNFFVPAITETLQAVLVSPNFLFVVEAEPGGAEIQRLNPHQLVTRLALFLWSSLPDDELLAVADSKAIYTDEVLREQVRRMLKDPRARGLGEAFGLQWLALQGTTDRQPDAKIFPEFSPQLSHDLREEAVRFVTLVFQEDRSLRDLIESDWIVINGRLAQHYGLDLAPEAPWQIVALNDRRRGGVVTLGGVLTAASFGHRTSPVLRGKWIMHQLLGTYVSPPPAGVPSIDARSDPNQPLTMRERLERHRVQPECAACHQTMDPLGFCLENYDAIGRWRDSEQGLTIDAAGELPSGEKVVGPEGLKQALLNREQEFYRHLTRKMIGFALGRGLDEFDECLVDRCLRLLGENNHRSGILIEEICRSYAFQYRYFKPSAP